MEFNQQNPIYLQIADNICERILSGELLQGERIASVREWAATIGVNPNTVARAYDSLTSWGVIFQKRGIGFFVSDDAKEQISALKKDEFIRNELPLFVRKAKLLGLNPVDLVKNYE